MHSHAYNHFGTHPDVEDTRDHRYEPPAIELPPSVDLSAYCGEIYDQGMTHTCSAHAVSSAITWLGNLANAPIAPPSRLFIYYNARAYLNEQGSDCGATMRDAIKSIVRNGSCPESDWPFDTTQITTKPPPNCYGNVTEHALSYRRIVGGFDHLKTCLAEGFPFVFAIEAYIETFTAAANNGGVLPMPAAGNTDLGGHAVVAIGYTAGSIKALNSLGPSFGDKGFFYIPLEYFVNGEKPLTRDFWTIRSLKNS